MPLSTSEGLLTRLRRETRAAHEELDASVGAELTRSVADYVDFLRGSLAAVTTLEEAIAEHLGEAHSAERADRLRADLATLGADESAATRLEPVILASRAEAFGAAYVVEGSALGGLVLAERVRAARGAESPCGYLELRGSSTGVRWKWFLGELASFDRDADEAARAAATARANRTFARYRAAFEQAAKMKRSTSTLCGDV